MTSHPSSRSVATAAASDAAALFALPPGALYLDSAAQGPRLHAVLQAGHAALDDGIAPWRLSFDDWHARIESLRAAAAATLFAGDSDGLAMVPSAAFGLATAARNLPLEAGDAVLVLEGQFPSNLLIWQQRCAEAGARVIAATRRDGQDWTAAVFDALDAGPRVRIVALPNAHWSDGALLDLDRIAARVHDHGAALVLDLSQSLGVLAVDLARWQPEFVVSVGHKWLLGATGLAWLWAARRRREAGRPIEHHWTARDAADWRFPIDAAPRFAAGARRFDAGGVTDPLRLAMSSAAMAQLQAWGVAAVASRLGALTAALDDALDARGLSAWKTPGHAPHLAALRVPADRIDAIAAAFAHEGIVCTRRHGVFRLAPHLHLGEVDMRRVVDVAARAAGGSTGAVGG